jgi:hypothetical protein
MRRKILSPDAGTAPNVIKSSSLNPVFNHGNHVAKQDRVPVPSHSLSTLNGNSKSLSNRTTRGELRFCALLRSVPSDQGRPLCRQGDSRDVNRLWTRPREATRMFQTWRAFGGRIKNPPTWTGYEAAVDHSCASPVRAVQRLTSGRPASVASASLRGHLPR